MKFGGWAKARFYLNYFLNKTVRIWFEVRRPKLRMFAYEMIYTIPKFFNYAAMVPSPFNVKLVETVFGRFEVRPHTVDMSNASPAFERDDIDHIIGIISGLLDDGKRVLFLDVGSDIGTFCVSVANKFKNDQRFSAIAFEPSESFHILKRNLELNGLTHCCEPVNLALFDQAGLELDFNFDPKAPGSSCISSGCSSYKVITTTIDDSLGDRLNAVDVLVIKIDVEGVESRVLMGGANSLRKAPTVELMVEDFVNPEIIGYLEKIGAGFRAKLTPYNSFWSIEKQEAP